MGVSYSVERQVLTRVGCVVGLRCVRVTDVCGAAAHRGARAARGRGRRRAVGRHGHPAAHLRAAEAGAAAGADRVALPRQAARAPRLPPRRRQGRRTRYARFIYLLSNSVRALHCSYSTSILITVLNINTRVSLGTIRVSRLDTLIDERFTNVRCSPSSSSGVPLIP